MGDAPHGSQLEVMESGREGGGHVPPPSALQGPSLSLGGPLGARLASPAAALGAVAAPSMQSLLQPCCPGGTHGPHPGGCGWEPPPPHAWAMHERGTLTPDRRACGTHAHICASFQKLMLQKGSPYPHPLPQKHFWGWRAGALLQPQLHRVPTEQNPGLSFLGSLWPNPAHVPAAGPPPLPAACRRASETKGSAGTMPLARLALCRAACGPPPSSPPSQPIPGLALPQTSSFPSFQPASPLWM